MDCFLLLKECSSTGRLFEPREPSAAIISVPSIEAMHADAPGASG